MMMLQPKGVSGRLGEKGQTLATALTIDGGLFLIRIGAASVSGTGGSRKVRESGGGRRWVVVGGGRWPLFTNRGINRLTIARKTDTVKMLCVSTLFSCGHKVFEFFGGKIEEVRQWRRVTESRPSARHFFFLNNKNDLNRRAK